MSSLKIIPESEKYSDWGDLPTELVAAVAKLCTSINDYSSIRGVCRSWRIAATFENFDKKSTRVPLLMHVFRQEQKETENKEAPVTNLTRVANFFDLSVKKTCTIPNFPPVDRLAYLSWSGWILCVSNDVVDVYLTHPLWRIKIYLPDLGTFPPCTTEGGSNSALLISRMVLSDSPTIKSDLLVMVIWGKKRQLGFCRVGDSAWTVMDSWEVSFSDIMYHNRRLYAVDSKSTVVECDVHGPNPAQIRQIFSMPAELVRGFSFPVKGTCYLVESSGKILIVYRHIYNNDTFSFDVYEFDLIDGSCKQIYNLGNRALFVGSNSSLSVDLSNWDGVKFSNSSVPLVLSAWDDVKSNCIYFTDHYVESMGLDTGVFCLSSMTIRQYFCGFATCALSAPPTWVLPSF